MSAGRKDGRSFRSARSAMEEETQWKRLYRVLQGLWTHKCTVKVDCKRQYYHAQKGQASDEVDVAIQSVDTPFEAMNCKSMAYWLGKFEQEVFKKNGERYPSRRLYGSLAGLKR